MKNQTQYPLAIWGVIVLTDTTNPPPQNEETPAPEEPYSPEPPVNTDFHCASLKFNI